jgi:pyrroline-5-carboxylate reductase
MLNRAGAVLLVGAGRIGGAMVERWLAQGLDPAQTTVLDPLIGEARRRELAALGLRIAADPAGAAGRPYDVMVLAVKPQVMARALAQVASLAGPTTVVLSVAAGVRLATLEAAFPPGQPIVRAMPNTPAQIGMGMTVLVGNAHLSTAQHGVVSALLAAVGKVAWVDEEAQIDAVTAVSGSGPAYVFLLAECLAEAGRQAGLPADLADLLGRQTVAGAGALLAESPLAPSELRNNVTSPQGTTAAALSVLMAKEGLQPLLSRAVEAARRRSIELG